MNLLEAFKSFLFSQENMPTKVTVKNYISDISQFIRWYENYYHKSFSPSFLNKQVLEDYKKEAQELLSASSLERHLSSLRKFFYFLRLDGQISTDPFKPLIAESEANKDPWHIKDFKSYLYVYNASHLTIKNYLIDIKQFLSWAEEVTGSSTAIDSADANILNHINSKLIEEYKHRLVSQAQFSPATINRKLSSLRKYLVWAQAEKLVKQFNFVPDNIQDQKPVAELNLPMASAELPVLEVEALPKPYSKIPPIRLAQKISQGLILALDSLLINRLASIAEKSQAALWSMKGQPVFQKAKQIRIPKSIDHQALLGIKNLPKNLYAPLEISTKYFPWYKKVWFKLRYTRPKWYARYHSYAVVHYFHFAVLVIFIGALSLAFYNGFINSRNQSPALASVPTSPPRVLSFQGRLTDASDNPITSPTNMRFAIYNSNGATGSALLWQEVDNVAPDVDGIFNLLLGNNTTIPSSLFSENNALWLGVTVESTPELTPRQQIATVAFASNSETLQGLLPITATAAGTANVVLALDSSGNLTIGGSANPVFQATGGQFRLSGQPLLLTTNVGSNGNVQLVPDGTGKIDLSKPLVNTSISNNIATAIGAVEVDDLFAILASSSGQSALTINQTGGGPLISASASGTTRFALQNGGQILAPFYSTCTIKSDSTGLFTCGTDNTGGGGFESPFRELSGAIVPLNSTVDFLIGGQSTASAQFSLTGVTNNRLTASVSGNVIVMPNNGWGGNVGIGVTNPTAKLEVYNAPGITGGELITNGNFASNPSSNGWTLGSDVTWGGSNVTSTYAGGDPSFSTTFSTTAGKTYVLTFDVTAGNAPLYYYLDNNANIYEIGPFTTGTHTVAFETTFTGTETIHFDDLNYDLGDTWTIDNVSIKEGSIAPSLLVKGYDGTTWLSLGGNLIGNTALGKNSLSSNTTGGFNSAYGLYSLSSNTEGNSNNAFGNLSLFSNTTGDNNNAFGDSALFSNTDGHDNSAFGRSALYANTTGDWNSAFGALALTANTGGINNSAFGDSALSSNTTGTYNSAFGSSALSSNTGGYYNNAIGFASLFSNLNGGDNNAIGAEALYSNTEGYSNAAVGSLALRSNTTGTLNVAFGESALFSNTVGGQNSAFGVNANVGSGNLINATALGARSLVNQNDSLVLGSINGVNGATGSARIGIGTISPTATLDIQGGNWGGRSAFIVNQTGNSANDIFTASSSGITKFVLDNSGNLTIAGNLVLSNNAATTTFGGIAYTWPTSGQANGYTLTTNGSGTLSWSPAAAGGANYWSVSAGAISPIFPSVDFLLGSGATSSAKFAVTNIAGSLSPIASLSATTASGGSGSGISIAANGTIQSLLNGALNLGGNTTGNINLSPNGTLVLNISPSSFNLSTNFNQTGTSTFSTGTGLVSINGNVNTSLIPNSTAINLGSSTNYWGAVYANNLIAGVNSTVQGFWQRNQEVLSPANITDDLLIGAVATPSASNTDYFQVFGTGSNEGNASSSGTLTLGTNRATATIQSARNLPFQIGGTTTGNILLAPNNGSSGGVVAPSITGNVDLGSLALAFRNIYAGGYFVGGVAGASVTNNCVNATNGIITGTGTCPTQAPTYDLYWNQLNGSLFANNSTVDILLGGQSTNSAKLRVVGANSPFGGTVASASVSGKTSFAAFVVNNDSTLGDLFTASASSQTKFRISNNGSIEAQGTASIASSLTFKFGGGSIQTTNMQGLTLGGATTGNITLDSGSGLIFVNDILDLSSNTITNIGSTGTDFDTSGGLTLTTDAAGTVLTLDNAANASSIFVAEDNNASVFTIADGGNITLTGTITDSNSSVDITDALNADNITTDTGGISIAASQSYTGAGAVTLSSGGAGGLTLDSASNTLTIASSDTTLTASGLATITLGTSATINAGATALNLQAEGAVDVNIAGGSAATGCTILNASGNLTCSGSIIGGTSGTQGYWQRSLGALSPTNITDDLLIGGTSTLSAHFRVIGNSAFHGTSPTASISGKTSFATLVVNNDSTLGDLFTASASSQPKFRITNNGSFLSAGSASISGELTLAGAGGNAIQTTNRAALTLGGNTTGQIRLSSSGGLQNIVMQGYTTAGCTLKADTSGLVTCGTDNTGGASGFNSPFRELSGAIIPLNSTVDTLLGGQSTTSAALRVTGQASPFAGTTFVASVSGKTSFAALTVTNNGTGDLFTASASGGISSPAYAATVLGTTGLVSYWRLGESAGTNANDEVATNDGTYTAGYTLAQTGGITGDSNTSVLLNGTTGYIQVTDHASLDLGGGPFSIEMWFRRTGAFGGVEDELISKSTQFALKFDTNDKIHMDDDGSIQATSTTAFTSDDGWHHVVAVHDAGAAKKNKIYIDGVEEAVSGTDGSFASNAVNLFIGRYSGGGEFGQGYYDEVAIYSSALTQTQVTEHYDAGTTTPSSSAIASKFTIKNDGSIIANAYQTCTLKTDSTGLITCGTDSVGTTTLLGETTLGAASSTLNVSLSSAKEYVSCTIAGPAPSAGGSIQMRFDSDSGTNAYGWTAGGQLAGTSADTQDGTDTMIWLTGSNTPSTDFIFKIYFDNVSGNVKTVQWDGTVGKASATIVDWYQGAADYYTTTGQVDTSVNFLRSAGNFAAGTYAFCEGKDVADYAENYFTRDKTVQAADVVTMDSSLPAGIQKASFPYDSKLIGVISTNPAITLDDGIGFSQGAPRPVALSGRIPVKVSTINGPIKSGDLLTSSTIPGVAMRATKTGAVVGQAMEAYDGQEIGKVMTFVKTDYYNGASAADLVFSEGDILNAHPSASSSSAILAYLVNNVTDYESGAGLSEITTDRVMAGLEIITPKIVAKEADIDSITGQSATFSATVKTQTLDVIDIITNTLSVASENITISGLGIRDFIAGIVEEIINSTNRSYISPIASIDELHTNIISPISNDSKISLDLSDSKLTIRSDKSASSSAVASIDNLGNATFSGTLSIGNDASIAGTLRASRIIADQIEGLNLQASTPSANYITNVTNISNTNVYNSSGSSFPTLSVGNPSASDSGGSIFSNLFANKTFVDIATLSSQLAYVENLNATTATFNQGLMVFGPSTLSDTSIVGQLSVSGSLILSDNSINVLGSDLNLQPLRQGGLSAMAGLFYIDTEGNVKIEGDATIKGTLYANVISPIPGSDLSIKLGTTSALHNESLNIKNASGAAILAINQLGDLVASGEAKFSKLNLSSLVAPALAVSSTEVVATGSAGVGQINALKKEMTINNPLVNKNSLIYITPTSNTNNQVLFLQRQVPGKSFTVGVQNPSTIPIPFNWIIVN